ncbi:MAG: trigger factor family protein, partial [Candidatus Electrothrix sp. AR3]|nr:trigger factor family protein [Candidatus Electrothrix sp. AR3]
MEIAVEEISELTRKVIVTLPAKDVRKELDKAYNKLKKEANLKGFRKGKAPRSVLEKNYRHKVEPEVAEQLVQATYFDAVEEKGLDVVVHPEIKETNFSDDGSFIYAALVDVKPVFEIKEYKGLEIENISVDITDTDIDKTIEEMRREHAVLRTVDDDHGV